MGKFGKFRPEKHQLMALLMLKLVSSDLYAEYGTFQRDLGCARAKLPVCRCASPEISGVMMCPKPLLLKFGKYILKLTFIQRLAVMNTFVCKIYLEVDHYFFFYPI